MRDYNALFDWLEKFKLTIYIDNFVKGGFDMTSVHGITAEVRNSRAYRSCGVIITHSIVMKRRKVIYLSPDKVSSRNVIFVAFIAKMIFLLGIR